MKLPKTKNLVSIQYHYDDGTVYYTQGIDTENYQRNMRATDFMVFTGRHQFLPVEWEKMGENGRNNKK